MKEKEVQFHGKSQEEIEGFPIKIREQFVQSIESIKYGFESNLRTKAMPELGKGVIEIIKNGKPAYRVVYVIKGQTLHIIHAYNKTSTGTDKKHKELIKTRHKSL
ncbi:hypothetical protein HC723_16475 [Vibrio sp. S11_S32]|uniref:type II toxin-antitoxin system RelE/ParE family toxin n=1 Tax=Vibrio sp. S11_S32 TaxID=2720225 RepID=UPI0016801EE4|nr:type II toxin-antitoxin system RelE/ParE family toxin [Vibrio sp. S11_S32]MBD1577985.1 hypothetical protein [Vibrio sp. S11_S32]